MKIYSDADLVEAAMDVLEGNPLQQDNLFSKSMYSLRPFISSEEWKFIMYDMPVTEFLETKFMFACFILLTLNEDF